VKTIRWPLILALLATAAYGGQVYRSMDANGNVVYSDRPTEKSEPVFVAVPSAGRPGNPIAPPDTKSAAGNPAANGQANAAGEKKKEEKTPAEKAAERAKNCQTAQDRKTAYDQSHRLYKAGPNGDRVYLNDAEIDEARARAAADVATWCG
jgi:Domain of unknown function (DUF4124)